MTGQELKARLRNHEPVAGTMVCEMRSPSIAAMLAAAGLDFFLLDTEHSPASMETVADICRGARGAGIPCIVRVPAHTSDYVSRTLDIGAHGLMLPRVDTAEQAAQIVRWAKYAPLGNRGMSLGGAHRDYGGGLTAEQIIADTNDQTVLVIQIESREAVANLDAICQVPAIDVLLVGPTDLSGSYGKPGRSDDPEVEAGIQAVVDAGQRYGIATGIHPGSAAECLKWLQRGMTFLPCGTEVGWIIGEARRWGEELRRHAAGA